MIAVAKADGQVQAEEKAILREICREIGIDPLFVDQILILFE
jgi:tellurite resistance protein